MEWPDMLVWSDHCHLWPPHIKLVFDRGDEWLSVLVPSTQQEATAHSLFQWQSFWTLNVHIPSHPNLGLDLPTSHAMTSDSLPSCCPGWEDTVEEHLKAISFIWEPQELPALCHMIDLTWEAKQVYYTYTVHLSMLEIISLLTVICSSYSALLSLQLAYIPYIILSTQIIRDLFKSVG